MTAPYNLILLILSCLLFMLAGLGEFFAAAPWPWGNRLIAWGLFCYVLSLIVR
jgi:hypothetical protein